MQGSSYKRLSKQPSLSNPRKPAREVVRKIKIKKESTTTTNTTKVINSKEKKAIWE